MLLHLLSPDSEGGGTAVVEDPSGLDGFMSNLGTLEIPPKKEPDGNAAGKSGGTDGAGSGTADVPPKPPVSPDTTKPAVATAKVADKAAKPEGADDAKPGAAKGAEKPVVEKEGEEEDWKNAKHPRSSDEWKNWKNKRAQAEMLLKKEIETREARIQELDGKLKEVEAKVSTPDELPPEIKAQIEKLTKTNEEMSQRLIALDVTQHPQFQGYFSSKVAEQKAAAAQIVGADKAAEFDKIMSMPESEFKNTAMEDFISTLSVLQQSRIGGVLNNLDAISRERQSEIAKASKHKEELDAQSKGKATQSAAEITKLTNDVLSGLQKEPGFEALFGSKPGDSVHNQAVTERIAVAKQYLNGQGLKRADLVKAAFYAAAMPAMLESWKTGISERDTEIASLKTQVEELTAANPRAESGDTTKGAGERSAKIAVGQTPGEALSGFVGNIWDAANNQ